MKPQDEPQKVYILACIYSSGGMEIIKTFDSYYKASDFWGSRDVPEGFYSWIILPQEVL